MNMPDDQARLKDIVEKRLFQAPRDIKQFFPSILSQPDVSWFTFSTDTHFLLAFIDNDGKKRIEELLKMGYHPFPNLVTDDSTMPSLFHYEEKFRNASISGYAVEDMFALSFKEDSTAVFYNHQQIVNEIELGQYEYYVDLAYVISFGDEINSGNIYDFLDDLIIYSINQWKSD